MAKKSICFDWESADALRALLLNKARQHDFELNQNNKLRYLQRIWGRKHHRKIAPGQFSTEFLSYRSFPWWHRGSGACQVGTFWWCEYAAYRQVTRSGCVWTYYFYHWLIYIVINVWFYRFQLVGLQFYNVYELYARIKHAKSWTKNRQIAALSSINTQ